MATADNVSSKFHRNVEDETPVYRRQLEQLAVEKNQLQAKLEASQQRTQTVRPVSSNPAPTQNRPTQVNSVVSSPTVTAQSKPVVKPSGGSQVTIISQAKLPPEPPQPSVPNAVVSPLRETDRATVKPQSLSKRVSEVNISANPAQTHKGSAANQSAEPKVATAIPKGFISVDDLKKKEKSPTPVSSRSIVASQGKSPMDLSKDLAAGLIVAGNRNELSHKSTTYRKVQTAIGSLRKGSSQTLEEAAQRAGIDLETLTWVAYYGQNRPGGIQISRANLK
ncbi:MAG: hypothetical protein QNJ08_00910 [Crocosphaera sp.]|nr:hypothetical protein [Crocosphaera sp.]